MACVVIRSLDSCLHVHGPTKDRYSRVCIEGMLKGPAPGSCHVDKSMVDPLANLVKSRLNLLETSVELKGQCVQPKDIVARGSG